MALTPDQRLTLNLVVCNAQELSGRVAAAFNLNIRSLLDLGLVTYGTGRRAYRVTTKGRQAL